MAATGLRGRALLTNSLSQCGPRLAGVTPSDSTWDTEKSSKNELGSINGCILGTGSSFHPE